MKILAFGDTQIGAGRDLAVDRLADQQALLEKIAGLAYDHDVDVVLHGGDVFEHRHPTEEARLAFKDFVRWLPGKSSLIIVAGNHDLRDAKLPSSVDLYDGCEFVRFPTVLDLGEASLMCLPWTPLGRVKAAAAADHDTAVAAATAHLLAAARDLRADCRAGKPAILALHWWLSGATTATGAGEGVIHEPVLSVEALAALGYDAVLAGHVHKGQILNVSPPVWHMGTPWVCNFGEASSEHGVWIIDTDDPDAILFVPLEDRRFVTVDVDLTDPVDEFSGLDETDLVAAAIGERFPLVGAVLRVRYRATEEQHRRVDHPALERLLSDASVHRVYGGIQWVPVRATRARVEGVDESLDPLDAVGAWCEANEIQEEQTEALHALTRDYLAAA